MYIIILVNEVIGELNTNGVGKLTHDITRLLLTWLGPDEGFEKSANIARLKPIVDTYPKKNIIVAKGRVWSWCIFLP